MNYYDKEDLIFEVLTGISVKDATEHERELASVKEMLGNGEVNQRNLFVEIEQVTGKNEKSILAAIHRGMIMQGKEWIRKIMERNVC